MNPQGAILNVNLAGLALRNPVILAAGTCGYLDEMNDVIDLARVGAVVTKSITRLPRDGNATWRIIETRSGMMNAIGLANVGVEAFARDLAPRIASTPATVIGSIAGFSIDDYVAVAAAMDDCDAIHAVEINVSCPNVHGGTEFGADPRALAELVRALRPVLSRARLFVKLSPIANGPLAIKDVAKAAIDAGAQPAGPNSRPGADAICLANTMPAMAIDVHTCRPRLANITGGLSGPAVHPIAVKLVHDCYRAVAKDSATPIIGIGGVLTWQDAAEFILAGATAVEMGTALFVDPRSPLNVVAGLEKWARAQGAASITELVGGVKLE
ncbi:MAG: dihydroorotate dehydrogenase [Phycisphaerae bacterium]|nr:dihydroorotate dehydrogenase [Phycisphaerae bacterium]